MADEDQDPSQKTEEPTQRRLDEALKRGQVVNSREVTNFLILLALTISALFAAPFIFKETTLGLSYFIESSYDININDSRSYFLFTYLFQKFSVLMLIPILLALLAAFGSGFIQHGFRISAEAIQPKLERISPLQGFKRLFSTKSVVELIKGIIKISLIGIIAYKVVLPYMVKFDDVVDYSINDIMDFLTKLVARLLIAVCAIMGVIAALDFLYQKYEHMKSLRMSRRELKDEYKQTEGDPVIKGRIKALRQERARKRMMAEVPKSEVVITNPTHYAVALSYDEKSMKAPKLVAKGKDLIALKIRKIAEENKVPVVENPPLAQALFHTVELDEEIPLTHYQAVAEVISYVYRLKGKIVKKAA